MMELIILLILASTLASLLVTRLTEKPLRIGFLNNESAANTYTTSPIVIPTTPSIALARGRAQAIGIEVMKVVVDIDPPSIEANQNNRVQWEIVKGSAPTAMLGVRNNRVIARGSRRALGTEVTAVGELLFFDEDIKPVDLTDGDGNGEIVADNEIHAAVEGSGNSAARSMDGYILYHLVQIDQTEALFELIETAQ